MPKKNRALHAALLLAGLAAIGLFSYFRVFDNYESALLDLRFALRLPPPQCADIAIIEISDDSIAKIGRWPFSRDWHASLINILSAYGTRTVVFDVIFSEPSGEDNALTASSAKAANVYYAFPFSLSSVKEGRQAEAARIEAPLLPCLRGASKGYGHVNVFPDNDGKTRRITPLIRYDNAYYEQLSFLAALDYLGEARGGVRFVPGREIILPKSGIRIPLDEKSNMLVNFAGKWGDTYRHFSYIDIITSFIQSERGEKGAVELADLKGKVCFVGLTATGLHDLNPSPLEKRYPGLGIHVNAFNTIVTRNFLRRAGKAVNLAILLAVSLLVGFFTARFPPRKALALVLGVAAAFVAISVLLFAFFGVWIDVFYPVIVFFVIYLSFTLYEFLLEMQKRQLIEHELEVAKEIQASFLPDEAPDVKGIKLYAYMNPAKHVAGDLYDFIKLGNEKIGVMIGDVSGKGVPAALYMAKAISEFRFVASGGASSEEVLTRLNDRLTKESKSNLFVTMTYFIYDSSKRVLVFSNGGHNPMILARKADSSAAFLEAGEGIPLGMMESGFSREELRLSKGDKLVLYTDGVTEAYDTKSREFGDKRLTDIVSANIGSNGKALLEAVKSALSRFMRNAPQHDDVTIIVAEITE